MFTQTDQYRSHRMIVSSKRSQKNIDCPINFVASNDASLPVFLLVQKEDENNV
jgi:hypothetical protein